MQMGEGESVGIIYLLGWPTRSVLSKNKRHFLSSPRTLLNNVFFNRKKFLANPIDTQKQFYSISSEKTKALAIWKKYFVLRSVVIINKGKGWAFLSQRSNVTSGVVSTGRGICNQYATVKKKKRPRKEERCDTGHTRLFV